MKPDLFIKRTRIEASAEELFRWHARPGALMRLTPPWEWLEEEMVEGKGIEVGARVVLRIRIGPFFRRWISEHRVYDEGHFFFRDEQVKGPFARWDHTHRFESDGPGACHLEDRIEYVLPLGFLGKLFGSGFVRKKLERMFNYRHRLTAQDIAIHQGYGIGKSLNILVTGSSGLIGSALVPFLTTGGHHIVRLVRAQRRSRERTIAWNPAARVVDISQLEGFDAVVHLAGEGIATGRWTPEKKAKIRDSRVQGTRFLCESLAKLTKPPKVLVSASAIGYYGDRDGQVLREESASGSGFLAQVCREWEAATEPAARNGIRVVNLRIGVVVTPTGGALGMMLMPFQSGLGGTLGSGSQYMSWIAMDDLLGAIYHALMTETLQGPVNAVAPNPVTNREMTKTLGHVLSRPTLLPVPMYALRLIFGELADEGLLASARVLPPKLLETGYAFRYPALEGALRHLLGRP